MIKKLFFCSGYILTGLAIPVMMVVLPFYFAFRYIFGSISFKK